MRIAISGSHHVGKSTVISHFLSSQPHYHYESEPYQEMLQQASTYDASDFSPESMLIQLELSLRLLERNADKADVIFERCPIDFIAYLMYFAQQDDVDLENSEVAEYFDKIAEHIKHLDIIAFLPLGTTDDLAYFEEDKSTRIEVDNCLKKIYRDECFNLFETYNHPQRLELTGDSDTIASKLVNATEQF